MLRRRNIYRFPSPPPPWWLCTVNLISCPKHLQTRHSSSRTPSRKSQASSACTGRATTCPAPRRRRCCCGNRPPTTSRSARRWSSVLPGSGTKLGSCCGGVNSRMPPSGSPSSSWPTEREWRPLSGEHRQGQTGHSRYVTTRKRETISLDFFLTCFLLKTLFGQSDNKDLRGGDFRKASPGPYPLKMAMSFPHPNSKWLTLT